jgi:D-alanine-D-alanine ligase
MKIKVGLFFGGKSTEHEVSVITAIQAFSALDKDKYDVIPIYITKENRFYTGESIGKIEEYSNIPALLEKSAQITIIQKSLYQIKPKKIDLKKPVAVLDVALACVHGTNVEDGALQGFFETHGLAYAGCDVLSSAVGMDKTVQKAVVKQEGIELLNYVAFTAKQFVKERGLIIDKIQKEISRQGCSAAIVKPVNLGSSIGIKIAADEDELIKAIEHALLFCDRVLAEPAIENLKEVNCAVLGDRDSAQASECEEPVSTGGILDFDDKYCSGGKSSGVCGTKSHAQGMCSLKRKIPAGITPEQRSEIRETAVKAFKALGCSGVARIDFLIDNDTNKIYFNEINTIPGSLSFYLFEPVEITYPQLLDQLIRLALKRERERSSLNFSFQSNILSNFKGSTGGKSSKF